MESYKNLNSFPIILPGKRRSSITIRPGEHLTDPWFSRFVGPRQLSRVNLADVNVASPISFVAGEDLRWPAEALVERESEFFSASRGVFVCKKCGGVRPGLESMYLHLVGVHEVVDPELTEDYEALCTV